MAYAIHTPANDSLESKIAELFFPPGETQRRSRNPLVWYKSFAYQAGNWMKPRRIVARVGHHEGELLPRVGFIVRNLSLPSRAIVRFYNKRARRSHGSSDASRQHIRPGCRVIGSGPMKHAYS